MNKSNYIFLGMAIGYILIATIQIRIDGLLPATLDVMVAFASLNLKFWGMKLNC